MRMRFFDESNQTQLLESGEKTQVANNYILTWFDSYKI